MLLYILYLVVHSLIDLYFCVVKVARVLRINVIHTIHFIANINVWPHRTKRERLKSYHFRKQPFHIGVVINEESVSFSDISNLILWCLCLHVRHISVYDTKGFVKKNGRFLFEQIDSKKHEYLQNESSKYSILFKNVEDLPEPEDNKGSNGKRVEKVCVHLLSQEDGHSKIVTAARRVCLDAKNDSSLLEKFCYNQFNEYMKDAIDIPEPELILLFGPTISLIGYLPWHVRFSEILSLPTHHSLQLSEVLGALKRFEQCEQRFGK